MSEPTPLSAEDRRKIMEWAQSSEYPSPGWVRYEATVAALEAERDQLRAELRWVLQRARWQQSGGQTIGAGYYRLGLGAEEYERMSDVLRPHHE